MSKKIVSILSLTSLMIISPYVYAEDEEQPENPLEIIAQEENLTIERFNQILHENRKLIAHHARTVELNIKIYKEDTHDADAWQTVIDETIGWLQHAQDLTDDNNNEQLIEEVAKVLVAWHNSTKEAEGIRGSISINLSDAQDSQEDDENYTQEIENEHIAV